MSEAVRRNAREVRGGSGILVAIRECCASRQDALIISVATGTAYKARFFESSDEAVTLDLVDSDGVHACQRMTPAFGVYEMAGGAHAFMAPVRDVEAEAMRLHLLPPTGGLSAKGRAVFRIPLLDGHGLDVRVVAGPQRFIPASAVDISVAGIQVEFEAGEKPELEAGSVCELELSYRGRTIGLHGLVRREAKDGYGFSFPGCMTDGELSPRPELAEIVAGVQRHWMENRS